MGPLKLAWGVGHGLWLCFVAPVAAAALLHKRMTIKRHVINWPSRMNPA